MWTNYHSHSHYCDGKYGLEAHVLAAIERGFRAFGFSSHGPMPYDTFWNMKLAKLPEYVQEARELKEKYRDQIELYVGIEADFIPGKLGPSSPHLKEAGLDYTIGSIHLVEAFENGKYWEIDGPHQLFLDGLNQIFYGDVKKAVCRYFELTREMIEIDPPTILGHMDKIKMQSEGGKLFSEEEEWYQKEVMKTLEVVAATPITVEVNTRGIYKKLVDEPYPSYWILEKILELDIPITLNSDSHVPTDIDKGFEFVSKQLLEMGFKYVKILFQNEWQERVLRSEG